MSMDSEHVRYWLQKDAEAATRALQDKEQAAQRERERITREQEQKQQIDAVLERMNKTRLERAEATFSLARDIADAAIDKANDNDKDNDNNKDKKFDPNITIGDRHGITRRYIPEIFGWILNQEIKPAHSEGTERTKIDYKTTTSGYFLGTDGGIYRYHFIGNNRSDNQWGYPRRHTRSGWRTEVDYDEYSGRSNWESNYIYDDEQLGRIKSNNIYPPYTVHDISRPYRGWEDFDKTMSLYTPNPYETMLIDFAKRRGLIKPQR